MDKATRKLWLLVVGVLVGAALALLIVSSVSLVGVMNGSISGADAVCAIIIGVWFAGLFLVVAWTISSLIDWGDERNSYDDR